MRCRILRWQRWWLYLCFRSLSAIYLHCHPLTLDTLLDLLPTTVWRKSKVSLLSKCSARQAAVKLHVSVIFWPQSRCSTVSQDVLRVIHHMNCCLPLPPTKKPSNVWLPIFCFKNVMTSSKIPKVCSNKKFKYSGSAISLSLLCARILFGRIRYLSSQPTHAVDKIFWGINFENQKVHHILKRVHEMVQGFTG